MRNVQTPLMRTSSDLLLLDARELHCQQVRVVLREGPRQPSRRVEPVDTRSERPIPQILTGQNMRSVSDHCPLPGFL